VRNPSTIDPRAAIAILVGSAPNTYAIFVGSAVSSPSVPTGRDLRRATLGRIYRAENGKAPAAKQDLDEWWRRRAGADPTYSAMLAAAFPTMEERRRYLSTFFEKAEPTDAHRQLAAWAKAGLARVFVTTNFDRLLERALEEAGVSVTSVSVGEQVASAPPREHSGAYVLKLHGDYGTLRLRNTDEELEALDPELEAEFGLILDRHGLIVLGYAGDDPAVARTIQRRGTRYGFYWAIRGEPTQNQIQLLKAVGGQAVVASEIAEFLTDIERRIAALTGQPEGLSSVEQYRASNALLRASEIVEVEAKVRRLSNHLQAEIRRWLADAAKDPIFTTGIRNPSQLESWRPIIDAIVPRLDPSVQAITALGSAAIEHESVIVKLVGEALRAAFSIEIPSNSNVWALNGHKLAVKLGADLLAARAVALSRWDELEALARLKMSDWRGTRSWMMMHSYVQPASLEGRLNVVAELTLEYVGNDPINEEMGLTGEAVSQAASDASALLGIVYLALAPTQKSAGQMFWGFRDGPSASLLLRMTEDDGWVGPLSRLAGEEPAAFRKSFSQRVATYWREYSRAGIWMETESRAPLLNEISGQAAAG
jgi:SIR2-like domain